MCRNIRPLFNYDPPSTRDDIHDAAVQFVRKVSGFQQPSEVNREVFNRAVAAVEKDISVLLDNLKTNAPKRSRAKEIEQTKERNKKRFG